MTNSNLKLPKRIRIASIKRRTVNSYTHTNTNSRNKILYTTEHLTKKLVQPHPLLRPNLQLLSQAIYAIILKHYTFVESSATHLLRPSRHIHLLLFDISLLTVHLAQHTSNKAAHSELKVRALLVPRTRIKRPLGEEERVIVFRQVLFLSIVSMCRSRR
jgi:hypothetical protein